MVKGNIHSKFAQAFPPPLRAASKSLPLSHPEVQVTEFWLRSVSGSGRHSQGEAWLTCPFLSPSGCLETFHTGCGPVSCRNKLKSSTIRIIGLQFRKQSLCFVSFLPVVKPYLISALFTGLVAIFYRNDVKTDLCARNAVFFLPACPSIGYCIPGPFLKEFFVIES